MSGIPNTICEPHTTQKIGYRWGVANAFDALVGLASLQAKQGDPERALELLLVVLNHPASLQITRNRASQQCAELEAKLVIQQVDSARVRAQSKTLEAVVEEVLKQV